MKTAEWVMLLILAGFAVYDIKTKTVSLVAVVVFAVSVLLYRFCMGNSFFDASHYDP